MSSRLSSWAAVLASCALALVVSGMAACTGSLSSDDVASPVSAGARGGVGYGCDDPTPSRVLTAGSIFNRATVADILDEAQDDVASGCAPGAATGPADRLGNPVAKFFHGFVKSFGLDAEGLRSLAAMYGYVSDGLAAPLTALMLGDLSRTEEFLNEVDNPVVNAMSDALAERIAAVDGDVGLALSELAYDLITETPPKVGAYIQELRSAAAAGDAEAAGQLVGFGVQAVFIVKDVANLLTRAGITAETAGSAEVAAATARVESITAAVTERIETAVAKVTEASAATTLPRGQLGLELALDTPLYRATQPEFVRGGEATFNMGSMGVADDSLGLFPDRQYYNHLLERGGVVEMEGIPSLNFTTDPGLVDNLSGGSSGRIVIRTTVGEALEQGFSILPDARAGSQGGRGGVFIIAPDGSRTIRVH